MDINKKYLKKILVQRNTTFEYLSISLGCNRSTLSRKIKKGTITLQDYKTIKKVLNLTPDEAKEIFGEI